MAAGNTTIVALAVLAASAMSVSCAGVTSPYVRPKPRTTLPYSELKSLLEDAHGQTQTTQQVHVSTVGSDRMRVTWITEDDAPPIVEYGTTSGRYPFSQTGTTTSYSYLALYHSGNIHDAVIGPLKPSTTYYYRCSFDLSREFSFRMPPSSLPFHFVIVGDLGQTGWTKTTLQHIAAADYDMLLLPGDLSYADFFQPRWDSYGRLVHAYERFARVYEGREDPCGPVYVTIGDGGNREGLAEKYINPQPKTSVFREASFGHGRLQVVNATQALWTWHRNDDDEPVVADSVWISSLASNPACNK